MKIAITRRGVPLHVPDGINVHIFALSSELVALGHKVYVISDVYSSPDKISLFFNPKYMPEVISLSSEKNLSLLKRLFIWYERGIRILKDINPDFIILNGAIPLPRKLSINSCIVSHDLEARKILGSDKLRILYKKWTYRSARVIVATCSELRDELSKELNIGRDKIKIIPTCFNINKYITYPLEKRINAILHIGTADYKNPKLTISTLQFLSDLDVHLYITGHPTKPLLDFVRDMGKTIENRVTFLGLIDESKFKNLLASVKVVSVPSTYIVPVASPTAIEALLSGTPVVSSLAVSSDVVVNEVNGYRCNLSVEEFANRFREIFTNENLWKNMSLNALQIAREKFDARNVAKKYIELYGEFR